MAWPVALGVWAPVPSLAITGGRHGGSRRQRGNCWWELLQASDAIKSRSELFVMVITLFQFILAHNCVGGRFPLVVITLVLNGTKFSRAGFFPPF